MSHNVDLKWSLWSVDTSVWSEHAPGVLQALREAFTGKAPAETIYSSPRKEIRYGTITVSKGSATVDLYTEWDSPRDLTDSEDPEIIDAVERYLSTSPSGDTLGARVTRKVTARSFVDLVRKIDEAEDDLLECDAQAWRDFEAFLKILSR